MGSYPSRFVHYKAAPKAAPHQSNPTQSNPAHPNPTQHTGAVKLCALHRQTGGSLLRLGEGVAPTGGGEVGQRVSGWEFQRQRSSARRQLEVADTLGQRWAVYNLDFEVFN